MNTMYRVDFTMKNKSRYTKTIEALDKAFDCENTGFEKDIYGKTVSFGTNSDESAKKLKAAAYAFLDELIYPCFLSVIWTDSKHFESHDIQNRHSGPAVDKDGALTKVTFILSKLVDLEEFTEYLKRCFNGILAFSHVSGNMVEFTAYSPSCSVRLYDIALDVLEGNIPSCFAGAYWVDFEHNDYEDCLKNMTISALRSGIGDEEMQRFTVRLPDDIVMTASFTANFSEKYLDMTYKLDSIFKHLGIDYKYEETAENTIEYISEDKHDYFKMYRAMQMATENEKIPCLTRAVLSICGDGIDKKENFVKKPRDISNHNICLKTEVAIECAAAVTGFIFRNYDLKHIPYPKDIKEIYERNSDYTQSLLPFKTDKELDRILEQIKADNEYVKAHTPMPHK